MKIKVISETSIVLAYFAFIWVAFFSIILIPDINYFYYLMAILIVLISFSVLTTFKYWHLLAFSFLVSIFYFQNIPIGLFGTLNSSRIELQALIASKSIILIGLGAISLFFIEEKKVLTIVNKSVVYFSIITIAIFFIYFIISPHGLVAKTATLRNIIMPMIAVLFGYVFYHKNTYYKMIDIVLLFSVLLALFGLFEYLFIRNEVLFDILNVKAVYYAKVNRYVIPGTLFSNLGGIITRRLVSFTSDPLAVGYWLCFASAFAYALKKRFTFIVLLVPLFLTFNKTAIAILAISIFLFISESKIKNSFIKSLMYFFSTAIYVCGILILYFVVKSSANSHILGLFGGISQGVANPIGLGMGSGGYFSWVYDITEQGAAGYAMGSDSAVGSVAAQVGIIGLSIYIYWFYFLFKKLKINIPLSSMDVRLILMLKTLVFSFIIALPMTENIMSINVNFMLFIVIGLSIRRMHNFSILPDFIQQKSVRYSIC